MSRKVNLKKNGSFESIDQFWTLKEWCFELAIEKIKNCMGQQNAQIIFKSRTKKCLDKYN